jgi:hypothetical protein
VAWHATIGGYGIICTIVILEIESAVVENGQHVE